MDLIVFLSIFFSISLAFSLILKSNSRAGKSGKLPPGPYKFPIIGNIFRISVQPHQSLAELSKTYGPLMSLKLGSMTTVIVSSPGIAKDVLQANDLTFSSRTIPSAAESLDHDKFSMVCLPVKNQWRRLRKFCKEYVFSMPKLDASQCLRREKLQTMFDYVKECRETGQVVNIGEAAFTMSLNLISATLFSVEFAQFNSESGQEMKEIVWGVMKCLGSPNLTDYFPILRSFDPQGILKDTKTYFGKLFAIFDEIIDEKLKLRTNIDKKEEGDLLEVLLDRHLGDESELSRDDIKHLLLDLFVAGTDSTSGTVEWAMTELIRNPKKMLKVRNEINNVVRENKQVEESDISKLPYLQAVVKETFRLHPAIPLLIPRKAEADVEINGYVVPKDAQVLVNVWAMGRDPNIWSDADAFMPERFLDRQEIDFKGKDFELLPFGAGRRICPGLSLAYRMVHLMVATFVHKFGWKLEDGLKPEDIDTTEKFGLTLQKAVPLKAFPTKL